MMTNSDIRMGHWQEIVCVCADYALSEYVIKKNGSAEISAQIVLAPYARKNGKCL